MDATSLVFPDDARRLTCQQLGSRSSAGSSSGRDRVLHVLLRRVIGADRGREPPLRPEAGAPESGFRDTIATREPASAAVRAE